MELAVEFNNAGARFLEESNKMAAFTMLRGACDLVMLLNQDKKENETEISRTNINASVGSKNIESAKKMLANDSPRQENMKYQSSFSRNDIAAAFCIYNRPFELQLDDLKMQHPSDQCSMMSAVVLFNLGLVDHLAYLQNPSKTLFSERALQLYSMADSLIPEEEDGAMVLLHLNLAIINNLCGLYYIMCDFRRSKLFVGCLQQLFTVATQCLGQVGGNRKLATIESPFFQEIILNIQIIQDASLASVA